MIEVNPADSSGASGEGDVAEWVELVALVLSGLIVLVVILSVVDAIWPWSSTALFGPNYNLAAREQAATMWILGPLVVLPLIAGLLIRFVYDRRRAHSARASVAVTVAAGLTAVTAGFFAVRAAMNLSTFQNAEGGSFEFSEIVQTSAVLIFSLFALWLARWPPRS